MLIKAKKDLEENIKFKTEQNTEKYLYITQKHNIKIYKQKTKNIFIYTI